ncbi:MAG: MurT ligase domain-containing protein [Clostridia bacterium]|nr:MurT ligase domain-containing protein [Clostridia bacterium]
MAGKRNLRFYGALWFAKGTALVLKLIGRKGTSMPGSWAIILCPDFIGRMEKPEKIVCLTGTNGKTTVANMVEDILEKNGYDFVCNKEGSNVPTGIASALIANSTFFGRPKKKLAVFEVDERSSLRIFPNMEPDVLAVTNIFRDSFKRNAHTEYIWNILNTNIPDKTKLILNADDPQGQALKKDNKRVTFGVDRLSYETKEAQNIVKDGSFCPVCRHELNYDFTRYHHIGKFHCDNCGYENPSPEYRAVSVDAENNILHAEVKGEKVDFKLLSDQPIQIYNQLLATAMLSELGMSIDDIKKSFEKQEIAKSRLSISEAHGKTFIRHLAKGQNPVACSRAMENTKNLPGKKGVVLYLDDHFDAESSVENTAWLYDTDFENLRDDSIKQILVGGARHEDVHLRLLLAGVPEEKIVHCEDNMQVLESADMDKCDTFVIFYDVYTIGLSNNAEKRLTEIAAEKEKNNG